MLSPGTFLRLRQPSPLRVVRGSAECAQPMALESTLVVTAVPGGRFEVQALDAAGEELYTMRCRGDFWAFIHEPCVGALAAWDAEARRATLTIVR